MIKAVVFDLGGVLVRTEDREPREALAKRLGMSYEALSQLVFQSESARLATLGKITADQHWEQVRSRLNLAADDFSFVIKMFWGGDRLDIGLVDLIRSLRSKYTTALLSNAWDDLREAINHQWKIADAFDELLISSEVGLAKPDERIYRVLLERLGVEAHEIVFVDDFIENIESARSVGLQAIHFQEAKAARDALLARLGRV